MKTVPLFSQKEIQKQVKEIARQINRHYGQTEVLVIGILKGAFLFYTDLLKQLEVISSCDFCSVSFYGDDMKAGKEPSLTLDIQTPVKGKNVLLVDCISDYGYTLNFVKKHIINREPKTLKTALLITKPAAKKNTVVDFSGFQVAQDVFVVGYGIDYKNQGRQLSYFAQVSDIN